MIGYRRGLSLRSQIEISVIGLKPGQTVMNLCPQPNKTLVDIYLSELRKRGLDADVEEKYSEPVDKSRGHHEYQEVKPVRFEGYLFTVKEFKI